MKKFENAADLREAIQLLFTGDIELEYSSNAKGELVGEVENFAREASFEIQSLGFNIRLDESCEDGGGCIIVAIKDNILAKGYCWLPEYCDDECDARLELTFSTHDSEDIACRASALVDDFMKDKIKEGAQEFLDLIEHGEREATMGVTRDALISGFSFNNKTVLNVMNSTYSARNQLIQILKDAQEVDLTGDVKILAPNVKEVLCDWEEEYDDQGGHFKSTTSIGLKLIDGTIITLPFGEGEYEDDVINKFLEGNEDIYPEKFVNDIDADVDSDEDALLDVVLVPLYPLIGLSNRAEFDRLNSILEDLVYLHQERDESIIFLKNDEPTPIVNASAESEVQQ